MEQIEKFAEEVRNTLRMRFLGGYATYGALVGVFIVSATSDALSDRLRDVSTHVRRLGQTYGVRMVGVRYDRETNECFYTVKHGDVKAEVKIA